MQYLLDTSPWANNVLLPDVIPARIQKLLATDEIKGLCSVSLLECAIHHRRGRLQLNGTLAEFFHLGLASDIELIEINPQIAIATNQLPSDFPGDPLIV